MIQCFINDNVTSFISKQQEEIKKVSSDVDEKFIKPMFTYSYSVFESTITEIFRYYLYAFPYKIEKNIVVDKNKLISTSLTQDILEESIDSYIRTFSAKPLADYLKTFCRTLDIKVPINKSEIEEISNMRNIIVHDSSKRYLRLLHTSNEAITYNLPLSKFQKYIATMLNILEEISNKISEKYVRYTYEKLVHEVWENVFTSPLLEFNKVWKIHEGRLVISSEYLENIIDCISSSERLFLAVFLQQYNDTLNKSLHLFNHIPAFVSLDFNSKNKLVDLIAFFKYYPYTFNGEIIEN